MPGRVLSKAPEVVGVCLPPPFAARYTLPLVSRAIATIRSLVPPSSTTTRRLPEGSNFAAYATPVYPNDDSHDEQVNKGFVERCGSGPYVVPATQMFPLPSTATFVIVLSASEALWESGAAKRVENATVGA